MGKQGDSGKQIEANEDPDKKNPEHVDHTAVIGKGVGDRSPNQAIAKMNETRSGGDGQLDLPEVKLAQQKDSGTGHGQVNKLQFLSEWGQKLGSAWDNAVSALQDSVNTNLGLSKNTWNLATVGAEGVLLDTRNALTGHRADAPAATKDDLTEKEKKAGARSGGASFSEKSDMVTTFFGLPEKDQKEALGDLNKALGKEEWIQCSGEGFGVAKVVDTKARNNDAVDKKYAKEDPGSYNCMAYALDKAGIHEKWMDSATRNSIQIDGDLLNRNANQVDVSKVQKGDIVMVKNEMGGYSHAGVVESVGKDGTPIIRQKPSAGQLIKGGVNEQDLKNFSHTWTGKDYDPSRIEIWHPEKK